MKSLKNRVLSDEANNEQLRPLAVIGSLQPERCGWGNCGSKNTVRYYDKETIDLLFQNK